MTSFCSLTSSMFCRTFLSKSKKKPKPDAHQIEAIDKIENKLKLFNRGQMIIACGTGKTLTALWIKEALNAQNTLVLLPSLVYYLKLREWAWAGNHDFEILNVCSDQSVGKKIMRTKTYFLFQ